jgi:hypothetical protein
MEGEDEEEHDEEDDEDMKQYMQSITIDRGKVKKECESKQRTDKKGYNK